MKQEKCPFCGNTDVYIYDATYDEEADETIGHFNCLRCRKGFNLSLGKGITVLIDP